MPPIESEPRDRSTHDPESDAPGATDAHRPTEHGPAQGPGGDGPHEDQETALDLGDLRELIADEIDSLESRLLDLIERVSLPQPDPEVVEVPVLPSASESGEEAASSTSRSSLLRRALSEIDGADSQSEVLSRLLEQCSNFSGHVALLLSPSEHEDGADGTLKVWNSVGFDTDLVDATVELPVACRPALEGEATLRCDAATRAALLTSLGYTLAESAAEDASESSQALLIPFILRDSTRALIFCVQADGASNGEDRGTDEEPDARDHSEVRPHFDADALQVLSFVAAQLLETLPLRARRPATTLLPAEWAIATAAGAPVERAEPEGESAEDEDATEPAAEGRAAEIPAASESGRVSASADEAPDVETLDPNATVALPSGVVGQAVTSPPPPPAPVEDEEPAAPADAAAAELVEGEEHEDANASLATPDREVTRHDFEVEDGNAGEFPPEREVTPARAVELDEDSSPSKSLERDTQTIEHRPQRLSDRPFTRASKSQGPAISPLSSGSDLLGTEPEDPTGAFELQDIETFSEDFKTLQDSQPPEGSPAPEGSEPEAQGAPTDAGGAREAQTSISGDESAVADSSETAEDAFDPGASGPPLDSDNDSSSDATPDTPAASPSSSTTSSPPSPAVFDSLGTVETQQRSAFSAFSSLQPTPAAPTGPATEVPPPPAPRDFEDSRPPQQQPSEPSDRQAGGPSEERASEGPDEPEQPREAEQAEEIERSSREAPSAASPAEPVVESEPTTELSAPSEVSPREGRAFERSTDRAPVGGSTSQVQPPEDVKGPGWAFQQATSSETAAGSSSEAAGPAHEEARRLARLLVSEIKLYNEDQIERGRQEGNIYSLLREDIDRSRRMYEERIEGQVLRETDYFRQELLRSLANGDASVLGC